MANASLEDCQLFAQSEILQRDLFIAAKQQEDHPKKREDCVQHEAESVSASSLKINRFRNRWNSGEAQVTCCANSSAVADAGAVARHSPANKLIVRRFTPVTTIVAYAPPAAFLSRSD